MIVTMKLKARNSVVDSTHFDVLCHSYAISWDRATTFIPYPALLVLLEKRIWWFRNRACGVLLVVCNILDIVTGYRKNVTKTHFGSHFFF